MFAYCSNNPIMGYDPTGEWTYSAGFSLFLGLPGGGYSANISLSCDSNGMLAIQYSYSAPKTNRTKNQVFGATASLGGTFQVTKLDSVTELNEVFTNCGINTPAIGIDAVHDDSMNFVGVSSSIGPTLGADVHINKTYTTTLGKPFKSLFKWIKEKFLK